MKYKNNYKLLLVGSFQYSREQLEEIAGMGYDITQMEREDGEITDTSYDLVVCNWLFKYHDIRKFPNLKAVQLLSAGTDRIDIEYIQEKNIYLNTMRGVYDIPMAEFAIGGVLQLAKSFAQFETNKHERCWNKNRGLWELSDKKLAVIGCGNIGMEVARKFSVFVEQIIGIDYCIKKKPFFDIIYPIEQLDYVMSVADIIVITLPLTEMTMGIINGDRIRRMKKDSILVNISRGKIINQPDLIDCLKQNLIGGAVLDVFEEEPLSENSDLWNLDNIVLTPHNAFVSNRNNDRIWIIIRSFLHEWATK